MSLSGWHVGFSKNELASELSRRFGWSARPVHLLHAGLTVDQMADILAGLDEYQAEVNRLRSLLRNCQGRRDDRNCAVCGDSGHQAFECHHIDLRAAGNADLIHNRPGASVDKPDSAQQTRSAAMLSEQIPIEQIRKALDNLEAAIKLRIAEKGLGTLESMYEEIMGIMNSWCLRDLGQACKAHHYDAVCQGFLQAAVASILLLACMDKLTENWRKTE